MSREAMQLALEALEDANDVARMEFSDEDYYGEAITALRQALETEKQWVGLTDEDICALWAQHDLIRAHDRKRQAFARAIEAKLKEKNT